MKDLREGRNKPTAYKILDTAVSSKVCWDLNSYNGLKATSHSQRQHGKNNQINSKYFANFKSEFDNKDIDITPYRFYEFWKYYYLKARIEDIKNLSNDEELNKLDIKIAKLNQQKTDLESELKPCEEQLLVDTEALLKLEDERNAIQLKSDNLNEKITDFKNSIEQIKNSKSGVRPEDLVELSKQHTQLISQNEKATLDIKEFTNKITLKNKGLKITDDRVNRINKQLDTLYSNLDKLIELKKQLREKYMEGFV